jgi:hypothetical protein
MSAAIISIPLPRIINLPMALDIEQVDPWIPLEAIFVRDELIIKDHLN